MLWGNQIVELSLRRTRALLSFRISSSLNLSLNSREVFVKGIMYLVITDSNYNNTFSILTQLKNNFVAFFTSPDTYNICEDIANYHGQDLNSLSKDLLPLGFFM